MAFVIWGFLLLLQGLQGMQGPKVSSEAWMGTPALLTVGSQPGWFPQILACRQSEGPTLALTSPASSTAWPFPSPCQCPQSWCPRPQSASVLAPYPLHPSSTHLSLNCPQPDTKSWLWCILHTIVSPVLQLKLSVVCPCPLTQGGQLASLHLPCLPWGDHISAFPAQGCWPQEPWNPELCGADHVA